MIKVLISEMRTRIDTYYKVQAKQLADIVPKMIGFNLVNRVLDTIQFRIYQKLSRNSTFRDLKEPASIVTRRQTIKRTLEILVDSRKIMLRDPALSYSLNLDSAEFSVQKKKIDKERRETLTASTMGTKI